MSMVQTEPIEDWEVEAWRHFADLWSQVPLLVEGEDHGADA
jgi:hypothetical protein